MKKKQGRYPTIQEYPDFAESSIGPSYIEEQDQLDTDLETQQFFRRRRRFIHPFFFFPRFFVIPFRRFRRFRRW
ncbi:hypothetical protein [Risungbinella massiliensis]|uniref:hypothetical protein n=1 Tax=Risungbinella massiliensis TaxID=1329796 RepID=UPI0005CC6FD0|nr:hypothetical protein [Risungbinella massiliensis]